MDGYLRLIKSRTPQLALYTFGTITGILIAIAYYVPPSVNTTNIVVAPVVTLFMTLGVFIFNDAMDIQLDRTNKRDSRPLVIGDVKYKQAIRLVVFSNIIALAISLVFFDIGVTIVYVIMLMILGILYSWPAEHALNNVFIIKNLIIALYYMTVIKFGMVVAIDYAVPSFATYLLYVFGAIVFIGSSLNDWRDVVGDRAWGRRTIPVMIGLNKPPNWFPLFQKIWFSLYFVVPAIMAIIILFYH
jgi:4-hydroxybenzoate polyprenyltransferase